MRYCDKCKYITENELRTCPHCNSLMGKNPPDDTTPVAIIREGGIEKERIIVALKDNKIPCTEKPVKKQLSSEVIFGVNSASADIFVPYGCYEKARDLLIGIGAIEPEENLLDEADLNEEPVMEAESDNNKNDSSNEFEEMDPKKRLMVRIISVILLIILIWGVVALTDFSMEMIKSFFKW